MNRIIICLLSIFILVFVSCNDTEDKFTRKYAMDFFINNSPERGAFFYNENRDRYPFLDTLYRDSIYPAITNCSYYELKNIFYILKSTPISENVREIMDDSKSILQESIFEELNRNMQLEQKTFKEEYVPIIEIGLDSIIHSDMERIIEEYAGGFLNYKKLYFLTGRDFEEFKGLWTSHICHGKYEDYIEEMSTEYLNIVCSMKYEYFKDITGNSVSQKFDVQMQEPVAIEISSDVINYVKDFTSNEKSRLTKDAIKDWIAPFAIGLLTGGTGAFLYEIGSTGYDIKVTIDDIKEQKIDSNDMLMYICEEDIHNQIKNRYLDIYTEQVLKKIKEINQRTYNLIDWAL